METLPDVYYIILDAYIRSDILREEYGYDNAEFLEFLRESGFFVAEDATSNYTLSALSLSSSLNMQHLLDRFGGRPSSEYPSVIGDMITHSKVRMLLEGYGYTTVALSSGWKATEVVDADLYLKPQISELDRQREAGRINAFESIFIRTTAGLALIDLSGGGANPLLKNLEAPFMAHHYFVLSQFEILKQTSTIQGPKFVFAHVISPHHPYVFGPDGELITSREAFTWSDGVGPRDSVETEMRLYRDQAKFVSQKAEEVIGAILANSDRPPVIIVQSDHGPGIRMSWGSPSEEAILDRMSILSAYLLPDACLDSLYPSITPVNSFTVMFRCVFGQNMELRVDRNYFSPKGDPYNFVDLTDIVQ